MGITVEQLESIAKVVLPTGYARFRINRGSPKPRLTDGIELLNARGTWAMSLFRNVNNLDNDVEIAIPVARIADDSTRVGAVLKWLEAVRKLFQDGEHKAHQSNYVGVVFRIGLKYEDALAFLGLFMAEVLKAPSKSPWDTSGILAAGEAAVAPLAQAPEPVAVDERANALAHMVAMVIQARDQSGKERTTVAKDKEMRFASTAELSAHVDELWKSDYCVLSGLKLDLTGADPEMAPSLDRIDSDQHYEPGNLQVVARFINRWKSDDEQSNFVRLLGLIKGVPESK